MPHSEILCTIGPASFSPQVLKNMDRMGATMLRINLSHTPVDSIASCIEHIRKHSSLPICLDSEGAQMRVECVPTESMTVDQGDQVILCSHGLRSDGLSISITPAESLEQIIVGDRLLIDFDGVLGEVREAGPQAVACEILRGGTIRQNRGIALDRDIDLPPLTIKDRTAIKIGIKYEIQRFALSFAQSAQDVELFRELSPKGAMIISKIESRRGLLNLQDIAGASDALLVDRGDLSREIDVAYVPAAQNLVLRIAQRSRTPVFIATNLLESMMESRTPTAAEVSDIVSLIQNGASGLVLAAETAIGKHPLQSLEFVHRISLAAKAVREQGGDETLSQFVLRQMPEAFSEH